MKIAIAGSGALGSRFGYMLYEAGNDVILIDKWKEHIDSIRENGLIVQDGNNRKIVNIPIFYPHEVAEEVDLVFVFTKSMGLQDMLEDIKPILGENTSVISLLNGIGHEDILKEYLPVKNIFMGVTIYTSGLKGSGHVTFEGSGTIEIQNFTPGDREEKKALQLVGMLNQAGFKAYYSEDVKYSIWRKACVNGAMNAICALLDCNLAEFVSTNQAEMIIRHIAKEFVKVAKEKGTILDEDDIVEYILQSSRKVGSHYPSMHQDLIQNHRLTEVDFLNGAVARMSKEFSFETPYNTFITQLIHAKEQIIMDE
ncbi:2-dehydropantoate 2-reductase [Virgibacillus dokdonensis]|uniref:2-dehydropantoate 2-reductase n=1 Tax=Virgibacillus dokdonensis TaxID=302167 RepID=UPI000989F1CC|nr:2-dehydropantoate 2-reductase [Virgibacillus dokdonensis]